MRTVPEKVLEQEQQTAPDARPHAGTAGHTQHTCHRLAPLPSKTELDFCKSVKSSCLIPVSGRNMGVVWKGFCGSLGVSPFHTHFPLSTAREIEGGFINETARGMCPESPLSSKPIH